MTDNVNEPAHYTQGNIECIDAIKEALGGEGFMAYCRGNVLKYLWRAERKGDPLEDLKKARVYLDWLLDAVDQRQLDELIKQLDAQREADKLRLREILDNQEELPF